MILVFKKLKTSKRVVYSISILHTMEQNAYQF